MTYHSGNHLIDPQFILERSQIHEGQHIADIGCGATGHIVFQASKLIGDRGIVYAVDILKNALQVVSKRARLENLTNIHTVWSDFEKKGGLLIPENSLDTAFMISSLFHSVHIDEVLLEVARVLKPKSRIVIVDWVDTKLSIAPKKLLDFEQVRIWAQKNNFIVQEEFEVGKYHKGLILFRHD